LASDRPVLKARDLTKTFGDLVAVGHVNLEIRPGEIYGFLGPNGAGKTTTLLMLLGILRPTGGEVAVFGERMHPSAVAAKRRIGVVPERLSFYEEMTAWEYLRFFAELYGVKAASGRAHCLLRHMDLWDWRGMVVGHFSHGMQRKLSLVRALIHSPDLIVLDEPVSGLDPQGVLQVREVLLEEHEAGKTIVMSSHVLSEVERLADRVGIMAGGALVAEDALDKLAHLTAEARRVEIEVVEGPEGLADSLRALPFVTDVIVAGRNMTVSTHADRDYRSDLGRILAGQGVVLAGMRAHDVSLEEAFLIITEADVRAWAGREPDEPAA
jgi:ABC-2 type transport system ATP-binding protein